MDFRILGPLEALDEGRQVALGGSKQRALLVLLLLHANETLTTDRLIDELWGTRPPDTAAKTVQVRISRLRKALAAETGAGSDRLVVTRERGYELRLDPERLDSHRFERLVAEGTSELVGGRPERAAAALEAALSLWRGSCLADLAHESFAQREIARLEELRVAAVELLVEAKPALGDHAAEPPSELDAARPPAGRDAEMAPLDTDATRSARRLVSIVFADLVGSTGLAERLDPESMHGLLDRYSEVCSAVIERHGGTVEGFIGDAVVGVFGLTELNEDDALRAVRAAVELREAGAELSAELERERGVEIAMKLGVESGEVFVSVGARRSLFAAGDAFNVTARLEGTAPAGEILLGENIHRLVRGAVRVEAPGAARPERADGEGAGVAAARP